MFKNPFSFEGRIRRMEYGISLIIYVITYIITFSLIGLFGMVGWALLIPTVWFLWAQGAKRCHDIDRSGWMQLIPFYVFFLLFENGDQRTNSYGLNPKNEGQEEDVETLDGHLKGS